MAVQSVEWKGGQGSLDAAVFGLLALTDFRKPSFGAIGSSGEYEMEQPLRGSTAQGEMVEDVRAALTRGSAACPVLPHLRQVMIGVWMLRLTRIR
jgi:hypothetical protein